MADILQLSHLCRFGALILPPSLPLSLFPLRQLKYPPSPHVSAPFNTWDGLGLRVHIWRVLLSVACPLTLSISLRRQPMRNRLILHLTLAASSNQPSSVPSVHAERKIPNGGSGQSERKHYPHKHKRVAMFLLSHGI